MAASLSMLDVPKEKASFVCWDRFKWEFRSSYPLFSLEEPSGRKIDVAACFAPRRLCHFTLVIRLLFLLWSAQVLYDDVVYTYPKHNLYIYLAYLTHWGHVLTIFYFTCSVLCCLVSQKVLDQSNGTASTFVKWTWGLYSLVAPLELAITVLYWGSGIADPHLTYSAIMEHGVLMALVWIDGVLVGNIPVRAKHVFFLISTATLYLIWTIVNACLGIGNGEWGPAYNDDALYPVLNWNKSTRAAAILSAVVVIIVAPALFYTCWLASLLSIKPKQQQEDDDDDDAVAVEEEGSRCCCSNETCGAASCCLVCDGSRRPLYNDRPLYNESSKDGFDYKDMDKGEMI